ncbi:MAG: transposase [Candidatus Aenigmatarchaeota archaeon]
MARKKKYVTKTCNFKLDVSKEQSQALSALITEFSKGVNFALSKIDEQKRQFKKLEEQKTGKCADPDCKSKGEKTKLRYMCRSKLYCPRCWGRLTGWKHVRKLHYSTSKRKVKEDIKLICNLTPQFCVTAFQKAGEAYKSYQQIKNWRNSRAKRLKAKLDVLHELLDGQNRIEIKKERAKVGHFVHKHRDSLRIEKGIYTRPDYTETILRNDIADLEKKIKELTQIKVPTFKQKVIRMMKGSYHFEIDDKSCKFVLKTSKDKSLEFGLIGGKLQLTNLVNAVKGKYEISQPEITMKGDEFYLHVPLRKELRLPKLERTFASMGIDMNIARNFAVAVLIPDKNSKPAYVHFWNSRRHNWKRDFYAKMRARIGADTNINKMKEAGMDKPAIRKKRKAMHNFMLAQSGRERAYMKYVNHNISHEIVEAAKNFRSKTGRHVAIILENLKNIRTTTESYRKYMRKMNRRLNSWNFRQLQTFIIYKAWDNGIPVLFIDAQKTSQTCHICGHVDRESRPEQSIFRCTKCSQEYNADFNAAFNIAKSFYNLPLSKLSGEHP